MKGVNNEEKTVKSSDENEPSSIELIRKLPVEKKKITRPKQTKGGKKAVEEKTSTILEQVRNMEENNVEIKGNDEKEETHSMTTLYEAVSPGPTITTSAVRSSLTGPIRMNRSAYILPTQPPPNHCRYPPPPPPSHPYYQPYPTHYCGRLPGRCVRPTNPYPRYCGPPLIDFSFPHCPTSYEQESGANSTSEENKGTPEIVSEDIKKDVEESKSGETDEIMPQKEENPPDKPDENDDRFSFRRMLFEENPDNGGQGQQAPPRRYAKIQTSIESISTPIMPPPPPPHPSFVYRPMFDFEHNPLEEDVVTKVQRSRDEQEEEIRERQRTISQILKSDSDRDTARYELDTLMVIYIEYILLDTKSILGRPSQDIVRHFAASIYDEIKCMQKLLTGKSLHMTHRIRQFLSIHSISFESLMKLAGKIQAASTGNFSNKQQIFNAMDVSGGATHNNNQTRRYIRPSLAEPKKLSKRQKKTTYKTIVGEESIDSTTDSEVELRCGIPPSDTHSPNSAELARIKTENCLDEVNHDSANAIVMVDDPVMGANVAADVVVGTDTTSNTITDNMQILSADIAEHIFSADQIEMLAEHASLLLQNEDACEEFMIEDDKHPTQDDPIIQHDEFIRDNRNNRRGRKKLSKKLTKEKRKFKKSKEIH